MAKRVKKIASGAATSPAVAFFHSIDLLRSTCAFQTGIHEDMLPFLTFNRDGTLCMATDAADHEAFAAPLSPWLARYGIGRILILVALLPHLRRPLFLHALYFGHMHLLAFLHAHVDMTHVGHCTRRSTIRGITSSMSIQHDLLRVPAVRGHLDAVRFLHEHNYHLRSSDAMERAARRGFVDVVAFLDTHRPADNRIAQAIEAAALHNHVPVLRLLHERHPDVPFPTQTLALVAAKGHVETVEYLLAQGAHVGAALRQAASHGHVQVIQLLLASGHAARVAAAMEAAHARGRYDVVALLAAWADASSSSEPPGQPPE
ncbi:Aste57867_12168 [Aphanomyces stellatus]|uniref:Aste57867_12168 protein n=1 Tax=Aphanomyces stellatus TaxID=120398 RepID=A0A485KW86_9STRA|nr:hypothetical protein As57867_012123 [Aphanomyces stellatus]VFT89022.1 Aste57867_12168 [Aphanomyces stellatus]